MNSSVREGVPLLHSSRRRRRGGVLRGGRAPFSSTRGLSPGNLARHSVSTEPCKMRGSAAALLTGRAAAHVLERLARVHKGDTSSLPSPRVALSFRVPPPLKRRFVTPPRAGRFPVSPSRSRVASRRVALPSSLCFLSFSFRSRSFTTRAVRSARASPRSSPSLAPSPPRPSAASALISQAARFGKPSILGSASLEPKTAERSSRRRASTRGRGRLRGVGVLFFVLLFFLRLLGLVLADFDRLLARALTWLPRLVHLHLDVLWSPTSATNTNASGVSVTSMADRWSAARSALGKEDGVSSGAGRRSSRRGEEGREGEVGGEGRPSRV